MGKPLTYVNAGYAFLLYLPLSIAGFYVTYFAVLGAPTPVVVHAHFGIMVLWLATLIAQPLLIKSGNLKAHRTLGKTSYVLVPLVLLSSYLLLKMAYERTVHDAALNLPEDPSGQSAVQHEAALAVSIAFMYMVWLAVFYSAAVYYRRNRYAHSRLMVAAALTLTGPTVDRIFFLLLGINRVVGMPAEAVAFLLIDGVMAWLTYRDYKSGQSMSVNAIAFGIYIALQAVYFILPFLPAWDYLAGWLFGG